ncbi:MAG TPA: hypothetical protein VGF13_17695 [Verrucomicrobiae bacterium]|jgi:hypothetical protein
MTHLIRHEKPARYQLVFPRGLQARFPSRFPKWMGATQKFVHPFEEFCASLPDQDSPRGGNFIPNKISGVRIFNYQQRCGMGFVPPHANFFLGVALSLLE